MPYKQHGKTFSGDPRHGTRWATEEEKKLATWALVTLENERTQIGLAPAPDPHFMGHKIRVIESLNPEWYREFGNPFWHGKRSYQLKRHRVEKALKRVRDDKIVRRNGYEVTILKFLQEWREEHAAEMGFDG